MQSWRDGTSKQYSVYLKKWMNFSQKQLFSTLKPNVSQVLSFLASLYDSGIGYSAINTARSALSSGVELADSNLPLGQHPLINRFLKGVFQSRPSLPRYKNIWSVATVLDYLKNLPSNEEMSIDLLSKKLVMLCLLVTGCRCQDVHSMHLDNMLPGESAYKFKISTLVKTSKPGKQVPELVLVAYPSDRRLCVVTCLLEYIQRTSSYRTTRQLFITSVKPFGAASQSTLSRWVKSLMNSAGIDINVFKSHSTRSASTSAAKSVNVPIDTILKSAGWSQTGTFSKFYNKPINNDTSEEYGHAILDLASN